MQLFVRFLPGISLLTLKVCEILSFMMSRGAFIVIEGVDRCGKTSQTKKLVESLMKKNVQAERMAFPDRTTSTGAIISQYLSDSNCKLNDQAIHLLFSANRWENADRIKEQLSKGTTLIVDRYSYSGMAFSAAKGMNLHWCMQPEIGLPKPDLVLYLSIKPETQCSRAEFGRERYETSEFQKKVNTIFKKFASIENGWQVVDANRNFDEVHTDLLCRIEKVLVDVKNNVPLAYLNDFVSNNHEYVEQNGFTA